MADPLPPIPAPPANATWRENFDYAVALQRHADWVLQAQTISAQTSVLGTPVASAQETDAQVWLRFMTAQMAGDANGLVRRDQGTGNMAQWADQALALFRARYPATP